MLMVSATGCAACGNKGYRGRLAIEGNVRSDVESDLRSSVAYLAPLLGE